MTWLEKAMQVKCLGIRSSVRVGRVEIQVPKRENRELGATHEGAKPEIV